MTLIIFGCKTTLHHCLKFNNVQAFSYELLVGRLYHPLSNLSTFNCFQCLLYLTSIHDLTLFLIFSYHVIFIYYFQSEAFFALYTLYLSFIWVKMTCNIPCYIALLHLSFMWGMMSCLRL